MTIKPQPPQKLFPFVLGKTKLDALSVVDAADGVSFAARQRRRPKHRRGGHLQQAVELSEDVHQNVRAARRNGHRRFRSAPVGGIDERDGGQDMTE